MSISISLGTPKYLNDSSDGVAYPDGLVAGDIIVAMAGAKDTDNYGGYAAFPGFTSVGGGLYYKVSDGTESGSSVIPSGFDYGVENGYGRMAKISGVGPSRSTRAASGDPATLTALTSPASNDGTITVIGAVRQSTLYEMSWGSVPSGFTAVAMGYDDNWTSGFPPPTVFAYKLNHEGDVVINPSGSIWAGMLRLAAPSGANPLFFGGMF